MSSSEPVNYEKARSWAEENRRKAVAAIPAKLQAREDRFLDQVSRAKVGPLKKLEMLYTMMDELSTALSTFTPCGKGCSFCCHYNVSVSEVEVAYIEKSTKHRRLRSMGPSEEFHGQPCPLLNENECSIYAARPFVCRRHHALTANAYWCHHERSNKTFPLIAFTSIDGAFDQIRAQTDAGEISDIRQIFGKEIGT
jgi:uncharacterized protein